MKDRVIQMHPVKYDLSEESLHALNRAVDEPIAPFGYAYVNPERSGRAKVDLSQFQWDIRKFANAAMEHGTREFKVFVDAQVRELLVDAFWAGVREAGRSDLKQPPRKQVKDLAERYATSVLGHG